jgi:hypothetical protein
MADPKRKTETSLRTPRPKKKLGLSVPPPLRMPHEELITAKVEAKEADQNLLVSTSMPSQTSLTRHTDGDAQSPSANLKQSGGLELFPTAQSEERIEASDDSSMPSRTSLTRHTETEPAKAPIAPTRDFSRVANSISRDVVPAGLFKGKSKQLYDCLYSMTRGAIIPSRTIRISRPKLMAVAGIGSRVTFEANVAHLTLIGLIEVRTIAGEHDGNEYRIYLPEERNLTMSSMPSLTSMPSQTRHAQKLVRLVSLETSQTRHTSTPDESVTYGSPNTFFNTDDDDDDTHTLLQGFSRTILAAARDILGGELPVNEQERELWNDCACVLTDELRNAAQRANSITSIPAFFAEHLRRRFSRKTRPQTKTSASKEPVKQSSAGSTESIVEDSAKATIQNASAGSKYSLEECRRYADHLYKARQGINNPGGYATTIFRTGEADSLIEKFLNPKSSESLDISRCPDCMGMGFYYPEGRDRGLVAKCKHPRLSDALMIEVQINQLRQIHAEDPVYERSDLIDDLRFRCQREGIAWHDDVVNSLLE